MTFTGGEHVRLKPTKEDKSPIIGIVVGVKDQVVEVEYRQRLGSRTTKQHNLKDIEEMCKKPVYRGSFSSSSECGRKTKEDHLCGMHLSILNRRERQVAEWKANAEAARRRADEAQRARADMADTLKDQGLYDRVVSFDGNNETVTLKLDTLLDLLRNA